MAFRLRAVLTLLASALALGACGESGAPRSGRTIGLYTSLPIVWGESGDIRELLAAERPQHWALAVLSSAGRPTALDTLVDEAGNLPLPHDGLLVLAQPRPLTPQENVALDRWVREGGRVLLFADPMLTAPSRYALGDPRRPQDTVLLSPILARWGLRLEFDEDQPTGERLVATDFGLLPAVLAGRFRVLENSGESALLRSASGKSGTEGENDPIAGKHGTMETIGDASSACRLFADGIIARCAAGKGRILAVSDAALFEEGEDQALLDTRRTTLAALIAQAESGD